MEEDHGLEQQVWRMTLAAAFGTCSMGKTVIFEAEEEDLTVNGKCDNQT